MDSMPRRLILMIAASALLLAPLLTMQLAAGAGRVQACSCAEPPPPLEALEEAAAVFSGTVVSLETYEFELDSGSDRTESYWSVEFAVGAVWKGTVASTTFVYVWHGPACGYGNFEIGEDFLVYADQRRYEQVDDATLFVSSCSRTQPLERAEDDLNALGEGQAAEPGIAGADPALSAEGETPDPAPTSEVTQPGPALASAGHGPASEDGERIAGPGAADMAAAANESAGPPAWAIAFLAAFTIALLIVRLATRPRRQG